LLDRIEAQSAMTRVNFEMTITVLVGHFDNGVWHTISLVHSFHFDSLFLIKIFKLNHQH